MFARVYLATCVFLCVCACVCVHVLDCVFGNSENVQNVYKVRKLMYCAIVHMYMCQNIFDLTCIRFNYLYSFLPVKCVHKCVDELHKISCNSYSNYILITQQRPKGASISSWGSSPTSSLT